MIPSRIIVMSDQAAIRVRALPDSRGVLVAELTQLDKCAGGYVAESARCFVPMDRVGELASALGAVRAEALNQAAAAQGRPRLRAALATRKAVPAEGEW